ncbi:hypothetical protein [Desulfoluna sp.]|uniref:hypothetical protein n=1 Tax=Desulfoluna sp. TaxID=2045199 RepID=UPI0026152FBB|nr:hypothetical protein [Desulfoluna sp.]
MAAISFSCSVSQGFNFQKDAQDMVGHINKLKIGEKELDVDLGVTDPEDLAGDKKKVTGVVSAIYWNGGFAESIQISCQVSNANKKNLAVLTNTELSNTSVEFQFTIYAYDPDKKKYYKAFHSNDAALKGLIEKAGGELNVSIDMDEGMEVVSPLNFCLNISVMPEDLEQETHLAFSVTDKVVKRWGVTVAA